MLLDLLYDIVMLKFEMVGLLCKYVLKMLVVLLGGMVKWVGIVCVIVLEFELLFFDELMVGFDL